MEACRKDSADKYGCYANKYVKLKPIIFMTKLANAEMEWNEHQLPYMNIPIEL